jgi:hypothetical protein
MNLLYRWQSGNYMSPRWMCAAYYSTIRNRVLYVAFPLNLAVALAWWVEDRWARAANAPSWIEREVRARMNHRFDSQARQNVYRYHHGRKDNPTSLADR